MKLSAMLRQIFSPDRWGNSFAQSTPDPYGPDYTLGTIQQVLNDATASLKNHDIPDPARDARRIMAHVLGVEASRITLMSQEGMQLDHYEDYWTLVGKRCDHVPVSHIVGFRDFFERRFRVTAHVLDPRPETETLVEVALAEPFFEVLDLGTGSGCISLTLLAERPDAIGIATDLSEQAIEVAQLNAEKLGVADRMGFLVSNWFRAVGGQFDLIVSNPPYISIEEMSGSALELGFEPRIALTDESDGLGAYRAIAAGVLRHLTPGGRVLLEIGPTQAAAVSNMLARAGLQDIAVHPDLDGRDRVISARAPG